MPAARLVLQYGVFTPAAQAAGAFAIGKEIHRVSVRIRLKRMGRRNQVAWRICATDRLAARDGRVIEQLGTYAPHAQNDQKITINRNRVSYWLRLGAQPSETVQRLLAHAGIDRRGNEIPPKPWRKKKTPVRKKTPPETAAAEEGTPPTPPQTEEEKPAE